MRFHGQPCTPRPTIGQKPPSGHHQHHELPLLSRAAALVWQQSVSFVQHSACARKPQQPSALKPRRRAEDKQIGHASKSVGVSVSEMDIEKMTVKAAATPMELTARARIEREA